MGSIKYFKWTACQVGGGFRNGWDNILTMVIKVNWRLLFNSDRTNCIFSICIGVKVQYTWPTLYQAMKYYYTPKWIKCLLWPNYVLLILYLTNYFYNVKIHWVPRLGHTVLSLLVRYFADDLKWRASPCQCLIAADWTVIFVALYPSLRTHCLSSAWTNASAVITHPKTHICMYSSLENTFTHMLPHTRSGCHVLSDEVSFLPADEPVKPLKPFQGLMVYGLRLPGSAITLINAALVHTCTFLFLWSGPLSCRQPSKGSIKNWPSRYMCAHIHTYTRVCI